MDVETLRTLIQAHLDQRLTNEEFSELEKTLQADPDARAMYVEWARLDAGLRDSVGADADVIPFPLRSTKRKREMAAPMWAMAASVAGLLLMVSWLVVRQGGSTEAMVADAPTTKGVAVITAEAGAVWESPQAEQPRVGVALEPGRLLLKRGLAQIDFFGGASVSLSGPAELELLNRDAAILHRGTLKAEVPPAARGFVVETREMLLEDLGTTFGLSVGKDHQAELVVFDGEVRTTGKDGEPTLHVGGEAVRFANGKSQPYPMAEVGAFPDINDVIAGSGSDEDSRYVAWKEESLERRNDPRLIAYYDFENLTVATRRLRNRAFHGEGSELDGGIVGARIAQGRWGRKTALDFRAEGDRVRFQIPGEYEELTIYAWVRIDALDRKTLNSLFLTDYFDENEIHWQISTAGALHFACSPMGVEDIPKNNRRFYSDVFWDPSQSGKWFLLATTAAEGRETVVHYVNGKRVGFSGGTNREKPLPKMRIGEADLGNWSEPIWPTSLRTLNGRIDEFAIYQSVLSEEEIRELWEIGRPQ
ncbi:MAG: LamG-like jellyroll fold domain-containing protein [Verrucomicrobiota bacterium]